MDSILMVSDISGLNYPDYLTVFLDNCLKEFPHTFFKADYMFALVYFIFLESGFSPIDLYDKEPQLCTRGFDIRRLRQITSYKKGYVRVWRGFNDTHMSYKIPIRFGPYSTECELNAAPSVQNPNFLVVNILKKRSNMVKSLYIYMNNYLDDTIPNPKYQFTFKNLTELVIFIKDEVCNPFREVIMIEEDPGSCANLVRLPEPVQSRIISELRANPVDIQFLSSTCSYFHTVTKFNSRLWQELCARNYSPQAISQSMDELFQYGTDESTIHKQIYLDLNKRYQKSLSNSYKFWK